ncbi:hypothetical protein BDC45DRAFT_565577 [Circinella umbellata]|nr:hypothetical protein BDC45DRAFT_565577 [Circinella umbellata]
MQHLLNICETHSYQLGFCLSPTKYIIVQPPASNNQYQLYNIDIPTATSFSYLGVSINYQGQLDATQLIHHNITSVKSSMKAMNSIGLNALGFNKELSCNLYTQFICPKLEYDLAIIQYTKAQYEDFEKAQDTSLRMIYGASNNSSTNAWYKLQKNIIWQQLPEPRPETTVTLFKQAIRSYHQNVLDTLLAKPIGTKTLAACRPRIGKDCNISITLGSDSKSITFTQEYGKGTVSSGQGQEERQWQLERFWSRFLIKPINQGFVDLINKTKEDQQSDKKVELPQLKVSLSSQTKYHNTVEEIYQVKNHMDEQGGIQQGSLQAVDSATQALQEVNNLRAELNSQLPVEMKKIYDAQGKIEGQVNTLTSSLQSIVAQLQEISNHQDKCGSSFFPI